MSSGWSYRADIVPVIADDERVLLLTETQRADRLLRGRLHVRLAPLLDGTRTRDEIVAALEPDFPLAHIHYALLTLTGKGLIGPSAAGLPRGEQAFWSGLGVDAADAAGRLQAARVAITGPHRADAGALAEALRTLRIAVTDDESGATVAVRPSAVPQTASPLMRELRAHLEAIELARWIAGDAEAAAPDSRVTFPFERTFAPPAASGLTETRVSVVSSDATRADADELVAILRSAGFSVGETPEASLAIALVPDYLAPDVAGMHHRFAATRTSWMAVKPVGQVLWAGPVVSPGATPCGECLVRRIRENRLHVSGLAARVGGDVILSRAELPSTRRAALLMAALEAGAWRDSPGSGARPSLLTYDVYARTVRRHAVHRHPACTTCDPRLRAVAPAAGAAAIDLQPRAKAVITGTGTRSVAPAQTLARLEPLVSPITGILPELLTWSSWEGGATCRPDLQWLGGSARPVTVERGVGGRAGAGGKGKSELQARVSCLAETVELYNGRFQGYEPRRSARIDDLGDAAVHPRDLLLVSERQYAAREQLNERLPEAKRIPVPFDDAKPLDWTPAWSVTHQRTRWLPTAYCYFRYPLPPDHAFCQAVTNGGGAGNNIEEAILHALLELVERDAVAIWWYTRCRRPGIDIASFDDPFLSGLPAAYAARGRTISLLDVTTTFGIPVVVAQTADESGGRIGIGFGCDLDPRQAAIRAVTELNQIIPVMEGVSTGPLASLQAPDTRDIVMWWTTATVDTHPYVAPAPGPRRSAGDLPNPDGRDLLDDLQTCVRRVADEGLELLVVDTTRPGVDMPTVRVAVPGLRHYYPRFAPGRLYDVPVRLGWVDRPLDESELNPLPLF